MARFEYAKERGRKEAWGRMINYGRKRANKSEREGFVDTKRESYRVIWRETR